MDNPSSAICVAKHRYKCVVLEARCYRKALGLRLIELICRLLKSQRFID